jgi:uncharacterized protein (TIGR02246 family)
MTVRPAAAHRNTLPAHDRSAILRMFDELGAGFNAHEAERADQHFTSDAVLVSPAGLRVEGIAALEEYHKARMEGPAAKWHGDYSVLAINEIDVDVAIVHSAFDVTTERSEFRNHGTFVVIKRDGTWWIAAAHNSNVEK